MSIYKKITFITSALLLLAACGEDQTPSTEPGLDDGIEDEENGVDDSEAADDTNLTGTDEEMAAIEIDMYNSNSEVVGTAIFDQDEEGVMIYLNLEDVPAGEYGMHIHEYGAATPPSFEDAGAHFDPTDAEHGFDEEGEHHLGDLPNLVVPENGIVNETIEVSGVSLLPDDDYTLATEDGTAFIIHTQADDYETQPTGDSGERMIGGVIFAPQN